MYYTKITDKTHEIIAVSGDLNLTEIISVANTGLIQVIPVNSITLIAKLEVSNFFASGYHLKSSIPFRDGCLTNFCNTCKGKLKCKMSEEKNCSYSAISYDTDLSKIEAYLQEKGFSLVEEKYFNTPFNPRSTKGALYALGHMVDKNIELEKNAKRRCETCRHYIDEKSWCFRLPDSAYSSGKVIELYASCPDYKNIEEFQDKCDKCINCQINADKSIECREGTTNSRYLRTWKDCKKLEEKESEFARVLSLYGSLETALSYYSYIGTTPKINGKRHVVMSLDQIGTTDDDTIFNLCLDYGPGSAEKATLAEIKKTAEPKVLEVEQEDKVRMLYMIHTINEKAKTAKKATYTIGKSRILTSQITRRKNYKSNEIWSPIDARHYKYIAE